MCNSRGDILGVQAFIYTRIRLRPRIWRGCTGAVQSGGNYWPGRARAAVDGTRTTGRKSIADVWISIIYTYARAPRRKKHASSYLMEERLVLSSFGERRTGRSCFFPLFSLPLARGALHCGLAGSVFTRSNQLIYARPGSLLLRPFLLVEVLVHMVRVCMYLLFESAWWRSGILLLYVRHEILFMRDTYEAVSFRACIYIIH